jgi:hypothetical protein
VVRSNAAGALFAFLLGSVLGFLSLFLREMGWVLGGLALTGMSLFYATRGRTPDAGWLLVAAGLTPAALSGRIVVIAITDPAVEVGPDTWVALLVASGVAAVGAIILYASRDQPGGDPHHG